MKTILLLSTLVFSAFDVLAAGNGALANAIRQEQRPTMEQIRKESGQYQFHSNIPATIHQFNYNPSDVQNWLNLVPHQAPKLIVDLESTYPNADWVFVGRDAALIADIFEAYYLERGIENRVFRLGVSKASFQTKRIQMVPGFQQVVVNGTVIQMPIQTTPQTTSTDIDDNTLLNFLKDSGIDISATREHPLIFVDTVSNGGGADKPGRQGRRILATIYADLLKKRVPAADLLEKFNMIGLAVSTFRGNYFTTDNYIQNSEKLLKKSREMYEDNLRPVPDGNGQYHMVSYLSREWTREQIYWAHEILIVEHAPNAFHEIGYTHFTGWWNDSYGEIAADPGSGKLKAKTGAPSANQIRETILWTQKELNALVSRPEFHKAVVDEAKKRSIPNFENRLRARQTDKIAAKEEQEQEHLNRQKLEKLARENDILIRNAIKPYHEGLREALIKTVESFEQIESPASRVSANGEKLLATWFSAYEIHTKDNIYDDQNALLILLEAAELARQGKRISSRDISKLIRIVYGNAILSNSLIFQTKKFMESSKVFASNLNFAREKNAIQSRIYILIENIYELSQERDECADAFFKS